MLTFFHSAWRSAESALRSYCESSLPLPVAPFEALVAPNDDESESRVWRRSATSCSFVGRVFSLRDEGSAFTIAPELGRRVGRVWVALSDATPGAAGGGREVQC